MQIKRLLVIPARSGSKRIKNKNFKLFHGKPIISYSLLTAINSKLFDKIVVSTDTKKYLNYLGKFNVEVSLRAKNLSDDFSSIESVLRYTVLKYTNEGKKFDEIWSLSPCSPMINKNDLIKASNLLKKNKRKIALPVTEYPAPINWAFKVNKKKELKPFFPGYYKIRSQDLPKSYYDVGNFVAIPFFYFKKKKIDFDKNYIGIEIPRYRSVDIDELKDWKFAEFLYEKTI